MEENENITVAEEAVTEEAQGIFSELPEESAEETAVIPENDEESAEETDSAEKFSAEDFARILTNPMFAFFARGRGESAEVLAHEFEKMLAAGRNTVSEEDMMKMTPVNGFSAAGGAALSERQRKIARDAGMSYREYYEIIRTIPTKTK